MHVKRSTIENKIISISTTISSILVPIFQYVPCTSVWFGIMSVPIISYLLFFFQNPEIIYYDIQFLIRSPGFSIVLIGFIVYIYSLIYQLTHKNQLIQTGPYKYIRHPQYTAFIIMTFGLTLITFNTSPVFNFNISNIDGHLLLIFIWVVQVFVYLILGKIEEIALKAKYRDEFLQYANSVPFIVPFLKLRRKN
ncbi:MAG: methyltransferase family protein [Candidatus Thorarchaeota archaeon]